MVLGDDHARWAARFQRVRDELVATLGMFVDGGRIWTIEQVGASAVPGLASRPVVDLLLELASFPPSEADLAALSALGLRRTGEWRGGPLFASADGSVRVHLNDPATEAGADMIVLRDYLRAEAGIRNRLAVTKTAAAVDGPDYERMHGEVLAALCMEAREWRVRKTGFTPVVEIAAELGGLGGWMIGSGWALDLYAGRPTRLHHDLDLVVLRPAQLAIRDRLAANGWRLDVVQDGSYRAWQAGAAQELPVTQAHARRGDAFLDVLFADLRGEEWFFRRKPEVTLPLARLTARTALGVPALAPEVVLLFKASVGGKGPRAKDEADLEAVLPMLPPERKEWLARALAEYSPGHPWLKRIASAIPGSDGL